MNFKYLISVLVLSFSIPCLSMGPKPTVNEAIDHAVKKYGLRTEPELVGFFKKANVQYPPKDVALLAFKQEQHIELWAQDERKNWHYIHTYPLTAYSGRLGPKLKEHDRQIPEGIYRLVSFNPFSSMHLSMMINYPNHFDRQHAAKDGRTRLGGDIFLHGKDKSVGCLAVGDRQIDQLFLLARRVGLSHIQLIIAPNDMRKKKVNPSHYANQPKWVPELYGQIHSALKRFPVEKKIAHR